MTTTTVQESRNVFHENPFVFLQELQDAIYDGFRVQNTIAGYPSLNSILKEVRTFRTDAQDSVKEITEDSVLISNYDPMLFLLDVQNAVLNDFRVDVNSISSVNFGSPKVAKMVRAAPTAKLSLDIPKPATPAEEVKPRQQRKTRKEAVAA